MQKTKPRIFIIAVGLLSLSLLQGCLSSEDDDCDLSGEATGDSGDTGAAFLNNSLGDELQTRYDCVS